MSPQVTPLPSPVVTPRQEGGRSDRGRRPGGVSREAWAYLNTEGFTQVRMALGVLCMVVIYS